MIKRILALVLTMMMALGTIAFAEQATDTKEAWWTPYDETVVLTTVRAEMNATFPEGDDQTNNIWTRSYKKEFNVDVQTQWISNTYDTKLNLAIASNELPDVFLVNNVQFSQLKEAGLLCDLTDAYEQYAASSTRSYMEKEAAIFETAKQDGRLYAMPRLFNGDILSPRFLWIRDDWMQAAGMTLPTTVDELEQLMLKMMENGAAYGMAVQQDFTALMDIACAWHANPKIWLRNADGEIGYGSIQPEMKQALATWADWYQKGIIKADFATMDLSAINQDAINGKVGVMSGASSLGWTLRDEVKTQGADAFFNPCAIPSVDGAEVRTPVAFPNIGYIAVSKDCEHPEAVMKLINYYNYVVFEAVGNGDMTIEEMTQYTGNNIAHSTDMFRVRNPMDDYNRLVEIQRAMDTGDTSGITSGIALECYEGSLPWINDRNPDYFGYAAQFGSKNCALLIAKEIVDKDLFNRSVLQGLSPEALLSYGSTLDDLLLEGFTKIVMGSEPIDYFDTLVETWKSAGGDDVTAAVNEMYGDK